MKKASEKLELDGNFMKIYNYIFSTSNDNVRNILIFLLRPYEWLLAKTFCKYYYKKYKAKYSAYKLILDTWDTEQYEIEYNYKAQIEKYNKWKENNPKKYKKIMEEFNKFLDKIEKQEQKSKWFFWKLFNK